MWKAALAGAVALATIGSISVSNEGIGVTPAAAQEITLTDGHLARLKSVLRLTPAQEAHWRAVVAVFRAIGRQHGQVDSANAGLVHRAHARSGYTLDTAALYRVASAARPLINSLDDSQKRSGTAAMRAMGVPSLF